MPSFHRPYKRLWLPIALVGLFASAHGQTADSSGAGPHYRTEIRRTGFGIPHIKAGDWGSLGYGYGYAQAQDNLCTMADGFLTYRGERSRYFGAQARPPTQATFGQPTNLAADFFFRLVNDQATIQSYRDHQSPTIRSLVAGFVAGYNRYVSELKLGKHPDMHQACRAAPWLGKISDADIYRRFYAITLAGGEARFIPFITSAAPPAHTPSPKEPHPPQAKSSALAGIRHLGDQSGMGSNALAFGAKATRHHGTLLLGNPHWLWEGPDRFYQAQLTIPGQLNISGVSFLSVPVIVIGFNRDIAWTHTVSTAHRFGLYQLQLVPGSPTSYRYDGKTETMHATSVSVEVRAEDGSLHVVSRTLYRSRFGPLVNLSSLSSTLAWNSRQAFALRSVNSENFRVLQNFLAWDQARSLEEFIHIQKQQLAIPWADTIAIGRNRPQVWFADIGAVPAISDQLTQACSAPAAKVFAKFMPGLPVLDGSRSACEWSSESAPALPGALSSSKMPSLLRDDYVGNFNGSFWLTQPQSPLTGYARILGETNKPQTLRSRLGQQLAAQLQSLPSGATIDALSRAALDSRAMSALLFKQSALDRLCPSHDAGTSDLRRACRVLATWNDHADAGARGAILWNEWWQRLLTIPSDQLYATPFEQNHPLTTPAGIALSSTRLASALNAAIAAMRHAGLAIDAPLNTALYITRNKQHVGLFGGCDAIGYFSAACPMHPFDQRRYSMDTHPSGNSYLQLVAFDGDKMHVRTMLASSESDDPASAHHFDATRAYAARRWLQIPFSEAEIARDPNLKHQLLRSTH